MLLETIKALIARFADYDGPKEQSHPSGTMAESTAVGSGPGASAGTYGYNANSRPTHEAPAFFPNARDLVINNPVLISQVINSGGTVLQLLGQKRIPGAEVESSARDPPPKCHPDTRKSLRGRTTNWLSNANRDWRMLWVVGPMGAGKSAVAQTIAEDTKETGQLGAALFFSRSNHRDDPDGVIPTLAYQLAVKSPEYKRVITQRLIDNPTILEKNRRTQFKELIIEPFQILMTECLHIAQTPLLIILDGLDECRSKEAQCELIELISDHARQVNQFPLLWMVCSRPEWHLKGLLSHPDFHIACRREEMIIDDVEAEEDVTLVLKEGFRTIYHKYRDYLEPGWPSKADFRRISSSASGHFAFASTILKYVGDPQHANPRTQLQTCVRFLGRSGIPGAINPLHALDLLYRQVLSEVPEEILEVTMRVLGHMILYGGFPLTLLNQANFLCIDQPTLYRSLQQLHSVLDIPSATDAPRCELRFHHTSFKDCLLDSYRSGSFSINKAAVNYNIASLSLKWQIPHIVATEEKHGARPTNSMLEWVHPEVEEEKILAHLRDYSLKICWEACCLVDEEDIPNLLAQLEHFDFNALQYSTRFTLTHFLPWLFRLANRPGVKPLMYQVTPDKPAIPNGTRSLRFEYPIDNVEKYLADFGPHLNVPFRTSGGGVKLLFQLGRGANARRLKVVVKPWRAKRSYTADKSDEISLSQGEIAHVVDCTQDDRWYVRKEDDTEGFVPSECFLEDFFKYRARTLCPHVASPAHPNEVSFCRNEVMKVIDDSEDWWEVEKSDGTRGLAASKFLALNVRSEYKARAVYNYTPPPYFKYRLSFNKGEIVRVIEPDCNGNKSFWIIQKTDGTVGQVLSGYFIPIETCERA